MPPTMQADTAISVLAQTIQVSLAPVFLLSGIAAFLNVLINRLHRVIDRTRFLEGPSDEPPGERDIELLVLLTRRHWINRAITLCTYSALLIAGVVALLFIGALFHFDLSDAVAFAFVAAMLTLIGGLVSFLREVHMAVRYFRKATSG